MSWRLRAKVGDSRQLLGTGEAPVGGHEQEKEAGHDSTARVGAETPATLIVQATAQGVFWSGAVLALQIPVGLAGSIVLARLLLPSDFGVYAVTAFLTEKIGALTELGLNTKLVYDHEQPSSRKERTIFSLQLALALLAYAGVFFAAPSLCVIFRLGEESASFVRIVGLVTLLIPFNTIPVSRLSRRLAYRSISATDLIAGCSYQLVSVVCAYRGLQYWSFALGALAFAIAKSLSLNALSPWSPGVAWDRSYLRGAVRFGGTYQLASLTSVPRDNIPTLLGGPLFGPAAVGLLNWAQRLAWVCSHAFVTILSRVGFPSLSRLRSDRRLFAAALERMLHYANIVTLFTLGITSALMPEIVKIVFTEKWSPAIPLFYCYALRLVAANYTSIFDLALRAHGRPERSLRILATWTLCELLLALLGGWLFGVNGIALAAALGVWFGVLGLLRETRTFASIRIAPTLAAPLTSASVVGVLVYLVKGFVVSGWISLVATGLAGGVVYFGLLLLIGGPRGWQTLKRDFSLVAVGHTALNG